MSRFGLPPGRGIKSRLGGFLGNNPAKVSGVFGLRTQYLYADAWPRSIAALYPFTTATFTNGGQEGRLGPSLAQARSGLSGPEVDGWKNDTEFFNTADGIQL